MTETDKDPMLTEADLDALFADLRAEDAGIAPDFLARLTAEALEVQPQRAAVAPARGGWSFLSDLLGGWQTAGGLGLAAMAGLWIGLYPPEALDRALTGSQSVDLVSDTLALLEEG